MRSTTNLSVLLSLCLLSSVAWAAEYEVGQQNKTFVKQGARVENLAVKKGDSVRFRNMDPFFHNVFSLSEVKTFDLGSYPKDQFKVVTFDMVGTVEVECAIHPQMHLMIEVR